MAYSLHPPTKAPAEMEAWILRSAPAFYLTRREVSWEELKYCRLRNQPIPVDERFSEHTIFSEPYVNHAMRALHDQYHLLLDKGYTAAEELAVSNALVEAASAAFLPTEALRIINADNAGQTLFYDLTGYFPKYQATWVSIYLEDQPVKYAVRLYQSLTCDRGNSVP